MKLTALANDIIWSSVFFLLLPISYNQRSSISALKNEAKFAREKLASQFEIRPSEPASWKPLGADFAVNSLSTLEIFLGFFRAVIMHDNCTFSVC